MIGRQPATLQLRYLQTLTEIAAEKNSTIVFPLPLDLIQMFLQSRESSEDDTTSPEPLARPTRAA